MYPTWISDAICWYDVESDDELIWWHGYMLSWCMTGRCDDVVMWWYDDTMIWWYDDMMIWWYDDAMIWWSFDMTDDMVTWCDSDMIWYHDTMTWWHDSLKIADRMVWLYEYLTLRRNGEHDEHMMLWCHADVWYDVTMIWTPWWSCDLMISWHASTWWYDGSILSWHAGLLRSWYDDMVFHNDCYAEQKEAPTLESCVFLSFEYITKHGFSLYI